MISRCCIDSAAVSFALIICWKSHVLDFWEPDHARYLQTLILIKPSTDSSVLNFSHLKTLSAPQSLTLNPSIGVCALNSAPLDFDVNSHAQLHSTYTLHCNSTLHSLTYNNVLRNKPSHTFQLTLVPSTDSLLMSRSEGRTPGNRNSNDVPLKPLS